MKIFFSILCITLLTPAFGQNNEADSIIIANFIALVAKRDTHALAAHTRYPVSRPYPLPQVEDSAEFVLRFAELFDEKLIHALISSDPKNDWGHFGWRGLSLQSEDFWLHENGFYRGGCYLTEEAEKVKQDLLNKDRNSVHKSIRKFDSPILLWESEKYTIRIDKVEKGYRYVSWKKGKKLSERPDLILYNGNIEYQGSVGYRDFTFYSGPYKYIIGDSAVGPNEGDLTVLKNDVQLLSIPCYVLKIK